MSTKLIGAVTLLLCSALMALGEKRRLVQRVNQAEELLRLASELRREVCLLHTPQPELLKLLGPERWSREDSFQSCWERAVTRIKLCKPDEEALLDFALQLTAGEEPERVLAALEMRLRQSRDAAENERRQRERLVPGAILCGGALLVIMLL